MNTQAADAVAREILARPLAATSLLDAIRDLQQGVEATAFPLDIPGVDAARESRVRLVDQLSGHLVPRLRELSAPAVVVVAGSTGAGKSTLVNSLVGAEVSAAGVLRPTTRRPVLVHHPDDADLLAGHPLVEAVEVVARAEVPRGIALMDAPDLDSVLETNREAAHRLLEAADLWLFVTTAARYGDALPWRVLQGAVDRGASIAMVLNRVDPGSLPTVRGALLERLRSHGMQTSPLFVIPDVGPHEGPLEPGAVAPISRWLTMLAGPDRARSVIARTLRGSLAALRPWVDELADAVEAQAAAASALEAELGLAAAGPLDAARVAVRAGSVAGGAARARWAELTTAGGPLAGIVGRSGRAQGSARVGRARSVALAPLASDVVDAAAASLTAAGAQAETVLRTYLTRPDGPAGGASVDATWSADERRAARETEARSAAQEWADGAAQLLAPEPEAPAAGRTARRAAAKAARRIRDSRRALGEQGVLAVSLAAAAGVPAASELVATLLGEPGTAAVARLREDLAERAAAQVDRERAAAVQLVRVPDLAPDAAARLRVRLAVLKGLT